MKSSKPLLAALANQPSSSIPLWYMRQAGRYLPEYLELREKEKNFLRFCLTPELCVEAACQPLRRFELDASILFADILLIPHMLGQDVKFEKGVGPVLAPLDVASFLDGLDEAERKKRRAVLEPVYQTVSTLKKELSPAQALIGFSGSVWTLACYMLAGRSQPQQEQARTFMFQEPALFNNLIEVLVEEVSAYLIEQIKAGAEVIQLFDSWSGVLSTEAFYSYVIEPTAKIVQNLKAVAPEIPIIGFPRGCGALAEPYAEQTGVQALSVDANQPFSFLRKLQQKVVIQGNLDPMLAVVGGEAMTKQAKKIVEELSEGAFIFGLSHGIVPQTPPDNIKLLTDFVHRQQ